MRYLERGVALKRGMELSPDLLLAFSSRVDHSTLDSLSRTTAVLRRALKRFMATDYWWKLRVVHLIEYTPEECSYSWKDVYWQLSALLDMPLHPSDSQATTTTALQIFLNSPKICKCSRFLSWFDGPNEAIATLLKTATSEQMSRLIELACENEMFDVAEGLLVYDQVDTVRASAMIKMAWRRHIKQTAPAEYKAHKRAASNLAMWPLFVFIIPLVLICVYAIVT